MKAIDKRRVEAQQDAQFNFLERLDAMRGIYQGILGKPAPDYPRNTLGWASYESERRYASKRVESLTHAIHELRDLAV